MKSITLHALVLLAALAGVAILSQEAQAGRRYYYDPNEAVVPAQFVAPAAPVYVAPSYYAAPAYYAPPAEGYIQTNYPPTAVAQPAAVVPAAPVYQAAPAIQPVAVVPQPTAIVPVAPLPVRPWIFGSVRETVTGPPGHEQYTYRVRRLFAPNYTYTVTNNNGWINVNERYGRFQYQW